MKDYLDKKIDHFLSEDNTTLETNELKELIGDIYISLRLICLEKDLFLDECVALAYDKRFGEK